VIGSFAGYAAPPLAGLGIAALLAEGKVQAVLILTIAAMALVLTVSRDPLTVCCVVVVGFGAFAALYWGPVWTQLTYTYTEAWLLLLCELAGVWVLIAARFRGLDLDTDDASALWEKTSVPRPIWILAWLALNGWALWLAVPLLWP
jgi:Zn-dependent protease